MPRPKMKAVALLAAVLLLTAGVVVTATAAPGPATDVKTAQYGAPTKPPTSGPCKGIGGEPLQTCLMQYKAYKAERKACLKKKGKKRKACLKKLKRKYPSFAK